MHIIYKQASSSFERHLRELCLINDISVGCTANGAAISTTMNTGHFTFVVSSGFDCIAYAVKKEESLIQRL